MIVIKYDSILIRMKRQEKVTPQESFFSHLKKKKEIIPWSLLDLLVLNEMLITASDKQ